MANPLRCVVGPRQVVREYGVNNGANRLRRFRVQYRDGRYDRRGRGFLGYSATITTDLDAGSGTIAVYGVPQAVDVGGFKASPFKVTSPSIPPTIWRSRREPPLHTGFSSGPASWFSGDAS